MTTRSNTIAFVRAKHGIKIVAKRVEFYMSFGDINRLNEFVDRQAEASTAAMRRRLEHNREVAVRAVPVEVLEAELDRRDGVESVDD